jgi:hypothetical protein
MKTNFLSADAEAVWVMDLQRSDLVRTLPQIDTSTGQCAMKSNFIVASTVGVAQ